MGLAFVHIRLPYPPGVQPGCARAPLPLQAWCRAPRPPHKLPTSLPRFAPVSQMSLDVKRAEIRKLQERSRQREEALKKSEAMLEEDAQR